MAEQELSVRAWSGDKPMDEAAVRRLMREEGLQPYAWSNGPGDVYAAHSHSYHKVIYVVQGSITFGLPDIGEEVHLAEGDRLDLPPGVRHDAVVGPRGVLCLEAHR
ncbi:MAG: cupin domain-containing protein [Chloroflexota bacterium]